MEALLVCRPCRRAVADMPRVLWIFVHVVLYVAVGLAALAGAGFAETGDLGQAMGNVAVTLVWALPLWPVLTVVAAGLLSLLSMMDDVPQRVFRWTAVILFSLVPGLVLLAGGTAGALVAAVAHLTVAVLLVQPRNPSWWDF
jgi:hypothetical protein